MSLEFPSDDEWAALETVAPTAAAQLDKPVGDHPADKHRRRNLLTNEMRRIIDHAKAHGRDFTPLEVKASEALVKLVNRHDAQAEADRLAQAMFGDRDRQDKRVFDSTDKVFGGHAPREIEHLDLGDLLRTMVCGTNSESIRNVLAEGTDSSGGYTVPVHLVEKFIDRMRAASVCVQAGAKTVLLETKATNIARLETDPSPGWRAENAAVAESDPTFGTVALTARSLAVMVKISRELLEDGINVGEILTHSMAQALALELDRVALLGSGTAPEPRGIFNTSGILSQSQGTNGAALTGYAPLVTAWGSLAAENCAPNAMVMAPRTRTTLGGLLDTTNQPLAVPGVIAGLPMLVTSQMPITQTQGSANNASMILVGDFTRLLIGVRTGLRIEVLKERYAENMQYAFIAHMRADIAVEQPKAFLKLIGIIP